MRGYGIDPAGRRAKQFDEFTGERLDYVVTLCDRVREICPDFPGPGHAIYWSMATYSAFERTAAEISTRIDFFIPLLRDESEVP